MSAAENVPAVPDVPHISTSEGARALDQTRRFLERFVAYPNKWASSAHALWIAHAHAVDCFENTPRMAFLSPEPGSGKSRAMEVTEVLSPNPLLSVNATTSAIFRSISDETPPTLLMDEVDSIFTGKADANEDLRGLLNSGYRQGAFALRSAVKGKEIVTEKWPTYCAVALAGLNTLPDTLMTRSVIVRMKRRRHDQKVEPFRRRVNGPEADDLKESITAFVDNIREALTDAWPELPEGIEDRNADLWEPLIAIADAAGGHWPDTAREAALAAVEEANQKPPSLGIQLLADIRIVLGDDDRISTADLLDRLHQRETSPWSSIKGEPIDARFVARMLGKYEIEPRQLRIGASKVRGYQRGDFLDAWDRYCPTETRTASGGSDLHSAPIGIEVPVAHAPLEREAVHPVHAVQPGIDCPIHHTPTDHGRCDTCIQEMSA